MIYYVHCNDRRAGYGNEFLESISVYTMFIDSPSSFFRCTKGIGLALTFRISSWFNFSKALVWYSISFLLVSKCMVSSSRPNPWFGLPLTYCNSWYHLDLGPDAHHVGWFMFGPWSHRHGASFDHFWDSAVEVLLESPYREILGCVLLSNLGYGLSLKSRSYCILVGLMRLIFNICLFQGDMRARIHKEMWHWSCRLFLLVSWALTSRETQL